MNYVSAGRSNYFRVRNVKEFKKAVARWGGMELVEKEDRRGPIFALLAAEGFPNPADVDDDSSVTDMIAAHLSPGQVAIFQESGQEGMRYVSGWARAVTNKGTIADVDLCDIYDKAAKALNRPSGKISRPEY